MEEINKNLQWEYFDGSSKRNRELCGGGFVAYLTDKNYFHITLGFMEVSNNFGELLALKLLLAFALEKGCSFRILDVANQLD